MLVTPDKPANSDFEQTQISQALVTTYARLVKAQNLANEVADRLGDSARTTRATRSRSRACRTASC